MFYNTEWNTMIYQDVPSSETMFTYDNEKQPNNANAHSFLAVVTTWHDNYKCVVPASAAVVTNTEWCFEWWVIAQIIQELDVNTIHIYLSNA